MQISVIIATYNRCKLLSRTLPALWSQLFPSDEFEVIVVVDGSTDGTVEYLRTHSDHPNLRVIEQPNRGQAAAINAGLKASRGELVLFLDDDILVGPTLVAEHARAPRTTNACLVFGPVMIAPGAQDPLAADWARTFCDQFFATEVTTSPELGWFGCMASANSSAPRSVILSVGGLDETFSRKNDIELGVRLLNAGFRFIYRPDAITHQIFEKTRRDVIEDAGADAVAEIGLCRKHPALRATSRIGRFAAKPWWKRLFGRVLSSSSLSITPLLRVLTSALTRLQRIHVFRRAALSLFQAQQNIAAYRSAVAMTGSWTALQLEFGARLPILMYHSIGPLREGFDPFLTISPKMFERHLRWLSQHGFTPIHLSDWVDYVRSGKSLPDKPVLLTFDDAYCDTAEFGFPLLQKYGFKGTLFVVTDQIGGTNAWDLHLGLSEQKLMTADQISYWAERGIEVGSHTKTHPDLRITAPEQIADQMRGSRERLEQLTSKPVMALAYPYGYFTDESAEIARRFYDAALTCDIGINTLSTDTLRLRRATVVPRYTLFDMWGSVTLGFNVLLIARIQLGLLAHRILDRFSVKPSARSERHP